MMSSKKTIKSRLAISQVDKNRYFSISVKLLPTRENFPMTKISNDMRIKELKALAEFQCATFLNSYQTFGLATDKTYQTELNLTGPNKNNDFLYNKC